MNNSILIRLTTYIVVISFLYSGCVYAIPASSKNSTLSKETEIPKLQKLIHPLASIANVFSAKTPSIQELSLVRIALAGLLQEEAEGITVVYNKDQKELFAYDRDELVHIYLDLRSDLSVKPIKKEIIGRIKIDFYKLSSALKEKVKGAVVLEGKYVDELSSEDAAVFVREHIKAILIDAGISETSIGEKTPEQMIELLPQRYIDEHGGSVLKDYLDELLKIIKSKQTAVMPNANNTGKKNRNFTFLRFLGITILTSFIIVALPYSPDIGKILSLLPEMSVRLAGIICGGWLIKQIIYGMGLLKGQPVYDLLSGLGFIEKQPAVKPIKYAEYKYKETTGVPLTNVTMGIKLSGEDREKLSRLVTKKDKFRKYILYFGAGKDVNKFAGIVIVRDKGRGILSVEVEWSLHEGHRQLSKEFVITELANRQPKGIIFTTQDINPELMDMVLPNHIIADTKESTRQFKEKVFKRLGIKESGKYTFFAEKMNFREQKRLYFSSFKFSSLWKMTEIDHWIYNFASGVLYALVLFSIFAYAESIKILSIYNFYLLYIELGLGIVVTPLAAAAINAVVSLKWDPVRTKHGKSVSEDIWLSVTQKVRMERKMIDTFKMLAYARIFLSITSILLIPAIGVGLVGISSPYIYLALLYLKLLIENVIEDYEDSYSKEIAQVAISFNESAKREGYAENFHNIESLSDSFGKLIFFCGLLIGFNGSLSTTVIIPLAVLTVLTISVSSFLLPYYARDYRNYLKIWGKGFTKFTSGKVMLADGISMIARPDNPNISKPKPMPITGSFSLLPWVEQLGATIECAPGHRPSLKIKNPKLFKRLRAIKGRCILNWPHDNLKIELVSRERPIDDKDVVIDEKPDGGCAIRFYPKKKLPPRGSPQNVFKVLCKENKSMTLEQIARHPDVQRAKKTVEKDLSELFRLKLTEKQGKGKSALYEVVDLTDTQKSEIQRILDEEYKVLARADFSRAYARIEEIKVKGLEEDSVGNFIRKFEKDYSEMIMQKIRESEGYRKYTEGRELDLELYRKIVHEREMAFCRHMIDHLVRILEKANGTLEKPVRVIQINTSMLYDIDETLGTRGIDGWHIRPSVVPLFKFLRDNFNVKIGICSTRGYDALKAQVEKDYKERLGLQDIAEFVDKNIIYSVRTDDKIRDVMPQTDLIYGRLNQIIPGFELCVPEKILEDLGWDEDKIKRFINISGPAITKIQSIFTKRRIGIQGVTDEKEGQGVRRDIEWAVDPFSFLFHNIRFAAEQYLFNKHNRSPEECAEFKDKLANAGITFDELRELADKGEEYSNKVGSISSQNRLARDNFCKNLSQLFESCFKRHRYDIHVYDIILRLAAAKDVLDRGYSYVSVAIDNAWIAELFYKLFMGEIKDKKGRDGYAIFNIEKYRNRLFIFSTGERGEYDEDLILADYREGKEQAERDIKIKRKRIIRRLMKLVEPIEDAKLLRVRLEVLLSRVQKGEPIKLTDEQLEQYLKLLEISNEAGLSADVAQILSLFFDPEYNGDRGKVVMAVDLELRKYLSGKDEAVKAGARQGLSGIREAESEKFRPSGNDNLKIYRTAKGIRFEGRENLKKTAEFVRDYPAPKTVKADKLRYVLIDKEKKERYQKMFPNTFSDIKEKWNVEFVTRLPKEVEPKDVVVLVDLEDAEREVWEGKGFRLFLPLLYGEKSFILAAQLSVFRPTTDVDLMKTPAFNFVKEFYKRLLPPDANITDTEIVSWFKAPWDLRDNLLSLADSLELLRIANEQIDTYA